MNEMDFEFKFKNINERPREEISPNRKVIKSENQSNQPVKDPCYLSPIHSRLSVTDPEKCPTCDKRQIEKPDKVYHVSPPKIRPSHHNVLCEDCSEGSYSRVLKVVSLNEEQAEPAGTKEIKAIESIPQITRNKSFPVIGNGKNVQVHYQEIYPPPKQEITSMIPECFRENGVLNYQLKEEERKRVAIRRAEYANRIKGVQKTIVTNIGLEKNNAVEERVSKSEKKILFREEREKYYVHDIRLGETERILTDLWSTDEKRGNDIRRTEEIEREISEFKKGDEGGKRIGSNLGKENREKINLKEDQEEAKKEISYLKRIQEEIKGKKNVSVKHKILAQLAGKDFTHLLKLGKEDELDSERDQESPKNSLLVEYNIQEKVNPELDECSDMENNELAFKEDLKENDFSDKENESKSFLKDEQINQYQSYEFCDKNNLKFPNKIYTEKSCSKNLEFSEEAHKKNTEITDSKQEHENQSEGLKGTIKANENKESSLSEHSKTSKFLQGTDPIFNKNSEVLSPRFITNEKERNLTESPLLNSSPFKPPDRHEGLIFKPSADPPSSNQNLSSERSKKIKNQEKDQDPIPEKLDEISQFSKIDQLFTILTDPQVIKGLKLLGGFADYLEKNGKEVLNWNNR